MMRALDLFCCGGGASMGLHRAGFEVVGVDIEFHKNYPFPMIVCDALEIERVLDPGDFDFIWASPPCQKYSWATPRAHRDRHPDLIKPVRDLLDRHGNRAATCIENVPNAPMRPDIVLDGVHFGLPLHRRRIFEVNFPTFGLVSGPMTRPATAANLRRHSGPGFSPGIDRPRGQVPGPDFGPVSHPHSGLPKAIYVTGGGGADKGSLDDWKRAMGIDWMSRRELVEAVPPDYAEAIGRAALAARAAA